MEEINNIFRFLASQYDSIESHIATLSAFLGEQKIVSLEYLEQNKIEKTFSLNVFTIASDLYYRENFHSDIICAFLDAMGNHNEGSTFLNVLIDLLNNLEFNL